MARIKAPRFELRSLRVNERNNLYPENIYRSYARINKKFIPVGWYIEWSDGKETIVLDEDVPSYDEARKIFAKL